MTADEPLTHVSLFSGIGGLDLAAEAAGFQTVLQVERDPYALKILQRHWPDVPRINDIREVIPNERWNNPTVVSGGFPCPAFSTAARGRNCGEDLWPNMLEVINIITPYWVVGENVQRAPIARAAAELELAGYRASVYMLCSGRFGAPHARRRWFVVANAHSYGEPLSAVDAEMARLSSVSRLGKWPQPPDDLGMDDGVPNRLDRLRALGNAVVPAQAYPIFRAIAQTIKGTA